MLVLPRVIAQQRQLVRRAHAQLMIFGQPQLAREAHRARPATGVAGLRLAPVKDPGPHDAPSLGIQQALGGKEGVVDPGHPAMCLGEKVILLVAANIVLATQVVANEKEHVPIA